MNPYYFVGSETELDGVKLNRFGQKIPLSDEVAKIAILGGAQLLPAAKFEGMFTDEEITKYPHPGQQRLATEDFKIKQKAAWVAVHEHRTLLETQEGK